MLMSKFPGALIDTLCFHERRDIDVIYTAAFDVRNRAVLAALTQIILRQARSLASFCDFLEWDRKHHLLSPVLRLSSYFSFIAYLRYP